MERPINVLQLDLLFVIAPFPFGTGVQTLDTTTTKTVRVCARRQLTFVGEMHTQHGGFFTSAVRRKTEIVFLLWTAWHVLCSESVHLAA